MKKQPTSELIDRLSNPIPYFLKGATEASLWGCGNCGRISWLEEEARHCYTCAPRPCADCDARMKPGSCYTHCEPCRERRSLVRLAEAVQKAPNKMLFEDYKIGCFVTADGNYHHELEELDYDGIDDTYPRFVFGCVPNRLQLSVNDIIESAIERADVDSEHLFPVHGERDLREAIKDFNEGQPEAAWFEEDRKTVLFLPWPDPKDLGLEPDEVRDDWPERWDAQAVLEGREPLF
jgi:hypothetical protein